MGLFGDLDVAAAADDPFAIDDGTYRGIVSECSVKESNAGKKGLSLVYTVTDEESPMAGRNASEWKTIPSDDDDMSDSERARAASFLKQRLKSLGIPEDRMNDFEPEDAIDLEVLFTVKTNHKGDNTYVNVTKVVLADSGPADTGSWDG
jgi:hypothetical protein